MAGQNNLLIRIAELVSGFDDASWEALASKGLLRRARKEIEKLTDIVIAGETVDALQINVPPVVVTMPISGPAKATCTCPAPGICQHILMAGLHLQTFASETVQAKQRTTEASIRDEISHITLDQVKAWVGSADFRAGVTLFERNGATPIVEFQEAVVI